VANVTVRKDNNQQQPQSQQQQQQGGGSAMARRDQQRGLFHGGDPFQELRSLFGMDPFMEMSPLRRLMRWDPFGEMGGFGQEQLFNPAIEIKETEHNYTFNADVPGLKESDVEVNLTGNRLVISGQRNQESTEERETYHSRQRSYGSFSRAFVLPEGADIEHVHAELKHGVLTIVVPKLATAQSRRIEVKPGGTGLKG
jgi:HSP20 family protein